MSKKLGKLNEPSPITLSPKVNIRPDGNFIELVISQDQFGHMIGLELTREQAISLRDQLKKRYPLLTP